MRAVQVIGPSAFSADRKRASQRSINWYPKATDSPGEDKPLVMAAVEGYSEFCDLGADVRSLYATDGRMFAVAGSVLYEINAAGASINRGSLSSLTGYVSLKRGRDQLCLVDGPAGYVMNLATNVFGQITDGDFLGSNDVDELDGYFIFVDPNTDQFYLSTIDDASTLDALDFSSADAQPDDIVTHRVMKRELYLFGTRSTEIWINSGDPDFPFTRYNSTPIDVGVVGQRAVIGAAETLVFVGKREQGAGMVFMMVGHQPQRISDASVEEWLKTSTDMSGVTMWSYQIAGAEFVGIRAPGLETVWVYDFSTRMWSERGILVNGDWQQWPLQSIVYFDDRHFGFDGAKIYELDATVTTFGDYARVLERTWPHFVKPTFQPITFRELRLACTTGTNGRITLECSNDGGYVYGTPLIKNLGSSGQRTQTVRWLGLGTSEDRVFRLRCSDAVDLTIHAASVDAA